MADILPDLLAPNLRLVFCGTAAGTTSAARGAYYARPGNRFWPTLHLAGFTPRLFQPHEFPLLPALGIGLTDLAKATFGQDQHIPTSAYDTARLRAALASHRPAHLAFTSKRAAAEFLGIPTGTLPYGPYPPLPGLPPITILPSPSGQAVKYWNIGPWRTLAQQTGFVTT